MTFRKLPGSRLEVLVGLGGDRVDTGNLYWYSGGGGPKNRLKVDEIACNTYTKSNQHNDIESDKQLFTQIDALHNEVGIVPWMSGG